MLYIAVLAFALLMLFRGARGSPVRATVAAAFVAIVFHTLLYAAFLEDPLSWTLLGIGSALLTATRTHRTAEQREAERRRRAARQRVSSPSPGVA